MLKLACYINVKGKKLATIIFSWVVFVMPTGAILAQETHYAAGDTISNDVFVVDKHSSQISLQALLQENTNKLNVLFIFGGGDMGTGMPGHLWCQDSFEDTYILRSLVEKYKDKNIEFIPVAAAPVYHSQMLQAPPGVFMRETSDSEAFKQAADAFINSSMLAYTDGILPLEPYFDLRFSLKLNRKEELLPSEGYGPIASWHGAFRAKDETQFYGVPSFWLLSDAGEILAEPFRGNVYHPHGGELNINYTLKDIDMAISALLVD